MTSSAKQLVTEFLTAYRGNGSYLRDHLARLVELAISEDNIVAEAASRAVFTSLVERLADSFEPEAGTLYNRVFAQVIQQCRADPRGEHLDDRLIEFGLRSEEDLIARAETLRLAPDLADLNAQSARLQLVIVLSRVTLGADVAITSVILERIKSSYPQAEIVLVGSNKAAQLFGGDRRVRFREIVYRRGGAIFARLQTWVQLLDCVRELTRGLNPGEYLIIDPDSRLTQLGLLPLEQERLANPSDGPGYWFFPSRDYGSSTSRTLGELTSAWLDDVLRESAKAYPRVSLSQDDIQTGRMLINPMKRGSQPVIAMNFGVGENQSKRVGGDFEESLVGHLIQKGNRIVLDKGAGEDEIRRMDAIIAQATSVERDGRRVKAIEIGEQALRDGPVVADAEILVWNGRIGLLAALIAESDLYIGYDSAGQHIAAALGVPCIDVFAGYSSPRMMDRWRPTGEAAICVVPVDELRRENPSEVMAKVLHHAGELVGSRKK